MVEIVWEYVVKDEARGRFELVYGPGGAWSTLFAQCPGYRGTTVLRDAQNPRRYLMIDLWDSEARWQQALVERKAGHAELMAAFAEWTESQTEVGIFSLLAEATVRPRGSSGRSKAGGARRRTRRTTR